MSLPVVDVSGLGEGRLDAAVVEELGFACREVGFFNVVGHGIDPEVCSGVLAAARAYFARPESSKLSELASPDRPRGYFPVRGRHAQGKPGGTMEGFRAMLEFGPDDPDVRRGSGLHGPNRMPGDPAFRRAVLDYQAEVLVFSRRLLRLFAAALGLAGDRFDHLFRRPMATLQLTHYRGASTADELGLAEHRDLGAFTVLLQDGVPGLEVLDRDGNWMAAPAPDGALTVNIGDWMETWSGGRFRSTRHRALNRSETPRYSVPFFMIPDADVVVAPLDELAGDLVGDAAGAAGFECGDYLRNFYAQGLRDVAGLPESPR